MPTGATVKVFLVIGCDSSNIRADAGGDVEQYAF
jgi:hypothetical protein